MATVVLAAALFCLSVSSPDQQTGELTFESPAAQQNFIEVYVTEPIPVEKTESAPINAGEAVADPVIAPSDADLEPIGKDVEPLDLIEPLFVEDAAVELESQPVESAPLLNEEPFAQPVETDAQAIDAAEPALVEPGLASETECATGADEESVEEPAHDETVIEESTAIVKTTDVDAESLDAIKPIILKDLEIMPEEITAEEIMPEEITAEEITAEEIMAEPEPDAVEEPLDNPATALDSPFVQSLKIIELQ